MLDYHKLWEELEQSLNQELSVLTDSQNTMKFPDMYDGMIAILKRIRLIMNKLEGKNQ
jgi:hypothetical protein